MRDAAATSAPRGPFRRRTLVGRRCPVLAVRPRQTHFDESWVRAGLDPGDLCRLGLCAPRSRSGQQRVFKPQSAMSTLPHDPRRSRASLAALMECLSASRHPRSLRGSSRHAQAHRQPLKIDVSGAHYLDFEVSNRSPRYGCFKDFGDIMICELFQYEANGRNACAVQYRLCLALRHG